MERCVCMYSVLALGIQYSVLVLSIQYSVLLDIVTEIVCHFQTAHCATWVCAYKYRHFRLEVDIS